jgi:hypothetical protein
VTPFDPFALVAMLSAFYPVVTPANFARARAERPEYFAGGFIMGSKGDKLTLPDGRVFDCIFAAGAPVTERRWICIDVTNEKGGPVDAFPLEPGPLVPLDEAIVIFGDGGTDFAGLVGGHLADFGGSEGLLDRAAHDVTETPIDVSIAAGYAQTIDPAGEQNAAIRAALNADNPVDVLERAEAHNGVVDSESGKYDEEAPPDIEAPYPGEPPDEGPSNPPPPQA